MTKTMTKWRVQNYVLLCSYNGLTKHSPMEIGESLYHSSLKDIVSEIERIDNVGIEGSKSPSSVDLNRASQRFETHFKFNFQGSTLPIWTLAYFDQQYSNQISTREPIILKVVEETPSKQAN